jgi:hypothetical protein
MYQSSPLPLVRLAYPLSPSHVAPRRAAYEQGWSPTLHTIMMREFWIWSKTDLLPQSRVDKRDWKKSSFIVCLRVLGGAALVALGHYTGILSLRCRGIKIYTTLRSATSASSSTPVWGHNLHDRCTRVCHRSPVIITALLVDRSWEIWSCVGNNFFVICTETQQWYQSPTYAYYGCTIRTHSNMWVLILSMFPSHVHLLIYVA